MIYWIADMIIPVMMIIIGWIFRRYQPSKPNYIIGYRTSRSMASQEAWIYANKRFAELWFKWGLILCLVLTISRLFLPIDAEILSLVNTVIGMICLIGSIPIVEKELKNKKYLEK